jgi:hypothetical protein
MRVLITAWLCAAGIAHADEPSERIEALPWVFEASAGYSDIVTTDEGNENHIGAATVDGSVRRFVMPRLAMGGRASALMVDGHYLGVVGPNAQLWITDQLWMSAGGGIMFGAASATVLNARVGMTFLREPVAPMVAVELTRLSFDGGSASMFSLVAGVQYGAAPRLDDSVPSERRDRGTTLVSAGAMLDVVALYAGARAISLRDRARIEGCQDNLAACPPGALTTAQSAYHYAMASTVLFALGSAGIGVGIYLRLTAPAGSAVTVAPAVDPTHAGATIQGSF